MASVKQEGLYKNADATHFLVGNTKIISETYDTPWIVRDVRVTLGNAHIIVL